MKIYSALICAAALCLAAPALDAQEILGTYTLSRDADGWYCHNVVLTHFKGKFYAQWQCSDRDEDAPDTRIYYCTSRNGRRWSRPRQLDVALRDSVKFISNGGWWAYGDSLTCFVNVTALDGSRSCLYMKSRDGRRWTSPRPVTGADGAPVQGIIEQDLKCLPDGRVLTAFHMGSGLVCTPYYTDDPEAISGWTAGSMPHHPYPGKGTSREIEPSWFIDSDGSIVMIFRDQASSHRKLFSRSRDRGETWTLPEISGIEDSRSKQSAGNLPDGRAFMVWNPSQSKERMPLALAISNGGDSSTNDGWDRYIIRTEEELPERRHDGLYKRRGYSYPKTFVWGDTLLLGYAVNKEDAVVTLVRVR